LDIINKTELASVATFEIDQSNGIQDLTVNIEPDSPKIIPSKPKRQLTVDQPTINISNIDSSIKESSLAH